MISCNNLPANCTPISRPGSASTGFAVCSLSDSPFGGCFMGFTHRFVPKAILALAAVGPVSAQSAKLDDAAMPKLRDDRFKWAIGAEGGVLFFSTQRQTMSGIPAAGAHFSIVGRRGGLH